MKRLLLRAFVIAKRCEAGSHHPLFLPASPQPRPGRCFSANRPGRVCLIALFHGAHRAWTAAISLDFSSQSRCASMRAGSDAEALRTCAALRAQKLPKLRRPVHGDVPLALRSGPLVKDDGMAPEHPFDRATR